MTKLKFVLPLLALVVFIFILIMGQDLPVVRPPSDSITVSKLLGGIDATRLNIFKVTQYNPGYLSVELNGKPFNMVPDSKVVPNTMYLLTINGQGVPEVFESIPLFINYLWEDGNKYNQNQEFYLFPDGATEIEGENGMDSAMNILLVRKATLPKVVDPSVWDGKQASFVVWEHPIMNPMVIQNINTGEIAFANDIEATDINGVHFFIRPGSSLWGVMKVEKHNGENWLMISQVKK